MTSTDRTKYVKSLHQLANLIELHPDLPIPYSIDRQGVDWYIQDTIGDALAVRDVMDDPKVTRSDSASFPVDITGTVAGLRARVKIVDHVAFAAGETVTLPALTPALVALMYPTLDAASVPW